FLGDTVRECRCTPQQIERYRGRLSGPLRDRMDLTVEVPALPFAALGLSDPGEASAAVRAPVVAARGTQRQRYSADGVRTNADLTPALLARYCVLDGSAARFLQSAAARVGLSARGYSRVRKVARTIADLAGDEPIAVDHLAEAMQF